LVKFAGACAAFHITEIPKPGSEVPVAVMTVSSAWAEDLFVGSFESETRENFGSSTPGEYRIEVVSASKDKYVATTYHRGKILGKQELVTCPVESEDYLNNRAPGRAEVLCSDKGYGTAHGVLSYSEKGIYVPAVKPKYVKNPELVKQEGLKPGDPSLFESRHHKTKYYAHVQWFFYRFHKVSP
jgi:hypothetical protein